ncbi:hypothetical protein B0H14DRAFT_2641902 [Mycena olivaceomarginata]|nr:hypothetical protein B0H14DRAFT_2641902 [Mycena olivaceomarginata]
MARQEASRSAQFTSQRWDRICLNCRNATASAQSVGNDCEFADDGQVTERQRLEGLVAQFNCRRTQLRLPTSAVWPLLGAASPIFILPVTFNCTPQSTRLDGSSSGQVRTSFGFFLNVRRFKDAAKGRSGQRPADVLLDVVHLWAIHLSGSDEFVVYEASYLSRALRTAANALSGTHSSSTVLHSIQAFILLSYYFLQNTRFLEGKYHLSAAVSLSLSARDCIGFGRRIPGVSPLHSERLGCHPPRDAVEEAERINAFWAVLTLNNCLTTADGSPSNISYTDPDSRIDTPWPLDINASWFTAFLGNQPDNGTSASALHAKAAILFEQASRLASQYRPDMNDKRQFYESFKSADTLIERFKFSLPTVQSHSSRELIVIHTLAHVAYNPIAQPLRQGS